MTDAAGRPARAERAGKLRSDDRADRDGRDVTGAADRHSGDEGPDRALAQVGKT